MTESVFLEQVSPIPEHDYFYFVQADKSLEPHAYSRFGGVQAKKKRSQKSTRKKKKKERSQKLHTYLLLFPWLQFFFRPLLPPAGPTSTSRIRRTSSSSWSASTATSLSTPSEGRSIRQWWGGGGRVGTLPTGQLTDLSPSLSLSPSFRSSSPSTRRFLAAAEEPGRRTPSAAPSSRTRTTSSSWRRWSSRARGQGRPETWSSSWRT